MYIAQTTIKGQILIPAAMRKKYHLNKGSRIAIFDKEGEIILKPVKENIIEYGHGLLKKGSAALKVLLQERRRDGLK